MKIPTTAENDVLPIERRATDRRAVPVSSLSTMLDQYQAGAPFPTYAELRALCGTSASPTAGSVGGVTSVLSEILRCRRVIGNGDNVDHRQALSEISTAFDSAQSLLDALLAGRAAPSMQEAAPEASGEHIAALTKARQFIEVRAEECGYGFARPANPSDFTPDGESCSVDEIAAHKAACEAFDKGEYTPEKGSEWVAPNLHILRAPWGIGSYTFRDEQSMEVIAEIDAALAAVPARSAPAPSEPNLKNGFLYHAGLDIKAALYTDDINGKQVLRDDLWLATTEALNALRVPHEPILAAPIDRDSFMRAAMDFAQAHINADEIEDDEEADPASDAELDEAHVAYNDTKAKLLEAYRAMGSAAPMAQDLFDGDDAALCGSIYALLALDMAGALVPHGVGGHARTLLATAALRLAAAPLAVPVQAEQSKPTDLSKRLRNIASEDTSPYFCTNVPKDDILAAADEIERYYGGMLAWKKTAEAAAPAAPLPLPVGPTVPHVMPQAVQVGGEPDESFYRRVAYNNGWNACRGFMIAAAPVAPPASPIEQQGNEGLCKLLDMLDTVSEALHYPACWDTAAYPSLANALREVYGHFKCSECAAPPVAPSLTEMDQENLRIGQQMQRAALELPDGWNIEIELERGYGGVRLLNDEGQGQGDFDGLTSDGLSYAIEAAVDLAIVHPSLPGSAPKDAPTQGDAK